MFIIQTNRTPTDFQSYMYEVVHRSWEEFKYEILGDQPLPYEVKSTMGSGKPRMDRHKVVDCLIDDDRHFEVAFDDGTKSSYMLVSYRDENSIRNNQSRKLEIDLQNPKAGCNCMEGSKIHIGGKSVFTCYECGGQYEV